MLKLSFGGKKSNLGRIEENSVYIKMKNIFFKIQLPDGGNVQVYNRQYSMYFQYMPPEVDQM